ncbi:MAG: hypothetical protein ACUVQ6_02975 [Dissulfurimicrobium sp.]|uniref:hypothetical protein n=2 Tax=Dissulfurimicrobium sp. TaxID=2022436 RepID=UPI0040490B62
MVSSNLRHSRRRYFSHLQRLYKSEHHTRRRYHASKDRSGHPATRFTGKKPKKIPFQRWFAIGILLHAMLYGVSPSNTGRIAAIYLFTGVTSASFLMWLIFLQAQKGLSLNIRIILPVLMLVLISMLLTRQSI